MNVFRLPALLCLLGCFFTKAFAQHHPAEEQSSVRVVPEPVMVNPGKGFFRLTPRVKIIVPASNEQLRETADLFSREIAAPTGYHLKVAGASAKNEKAIRLTLNTVPDNTIGDEGYRLEVSPARIDIHANKPAGVFYGLQTLMQLVPPGLSAGKPGVNGKTEIARVNLDIPCVHIMDYPRFGWRGLMLDVSRHFFSKDFVKAYIDEMVKYKYNVFHWHLTDDNGWRIEIKGLPGLTETGAWRVPRTGRWGEFKAPRPGEKATDGGYYTQEDIKEIVKYAQERFVTIVPEVDVPAHSLSLIAAYPNLSCTQLQYDVNPGSPFYKAADNVLCVANDSTWLILDKIFTQIAALFPGKYIHVGGDEAYKGFWEKCPKDQALMQREHLKNTDELQSYFEKKMEKIILSKGKKMIGWDEILEGGLAPEATVMSWRGIQGGIAAAKMNHHVVMTPWGSCYLDLYQGDPVVEPPTYGELRLRTCYDYEPVPEGVDPKLVLGGQGNLWAESVPNERQAEYMTWPRALALAEVFWSPKDKRNWDDFVKRMEAQFPRFDAAHVKYARSAYQAIITPVKDSTVNDSMRVQLSTEIPGLDIYYTFDDTNPDQFYQKYDGEPLTIPLGAARLNVVTYRDGKPAGEQINMPLEVLKKRMK